MRTKLRSKIALLFTTLGLLLAFPAVALAGDLITDAELATNVNAPTAVKKGDNSFQIKVWANGNVNGDGKTYVVDKYNMAANGTITADTTQKETLLFTANTNHDPNLNGGYCNPSTYPSGNVPQGCKGNPFVVDAILNVNSGAADGQAGTLQVAVDISASGDGFGGSTRDTGYVKVDAVNPTVTINTPGSGASYAQGQSVTADYSCADTQSVIANSGVKSCIGTVANGNAIDTSSTGSKSFTVTATDNAGNTASVTHNYTVASANTAPNTPGAPTLDSTSVSPNNTGSFKINWAAANPVDPDTNDTVTYTLEKKATNALSWSQVASNLSVTNYTFTNEAESTWSFRVKAVDNHGASSGYATANNLVKVDKSAPSQPNADFSKTAEDSVGGWFKDSVTVTYSGSTDPTLADASAGSGVASYTAGQLFNTSGTHNYSGTATDNAGNVSAARTGSVKVDTNNPTFGACPTAGPFLFNSGSQSVGSISAFDTGESGVSANSTLSGSVDTSTVGTKQVTFTALDNVGHSDTRQCSYSVLYDYSGVLQPINSDGSSIFKAGSTVPVKFKLLNGSSAITDAAVSLKYTKLTNGIAGDELEAVTNVAATTGNLFRYDATSGQYIFNWSTKGLSDGTYRLSFLLADGTVQGTATISLKK